METLFLIAILLGAAFIGWKLLQPSPAKPPNYIGAAASLVPILNALHD